MADAPLNPADQAELDRLAARSRRGLELSPRQVWQLSTRLMLQAPVGLTERQIKAVAYDLDQRIRGLPPGAFMALDALRLLAEGGNIVAADLFQSECVKLGLTTPMRSFPR